MRTWKNLFIVALIGAFCFGGTFTCSTDGDGDKIHGSVTTNQ